MMKNYILICGFTMALFPVFLISAQEIRWNNAPETGFVFKISNKEARRLLIKSSPDTIINRLLHTQVDTFNIAAGWKRKPAQGHLIFVKIIENKLHCEYESVFPYQVVLLREYNALALQVLDHEGNIRKDARVKFRSRRVRFNSSTNTYRVENEWFNGQNKFVTVELDGFLSVFNIEKHDVPSWTNDYYHPDEGPDFYSYMITDKNKYKPGERVRFKSYALSGSRSPIRKDLEVWLMKSGRPLKVGTVTPHRPGSFAGEFVLHDSLKLTLDRSYTVQLWDKHGRVVSNSSFRYEDYELHGNRLAVELETEQQYSPASNFVKVKATDENGLILKDARATIMVLTENIREVFQPVVMLPDTLLLREVYLNPEGETLVEIPASLFGKSNTGYRVYVTALNSENQRMEAGARASHYFSRFELKASYVNDSILYQVLDKGIPFDSVSAKVYRDGGMEGMQMVLPHKEKINPAATSIRFESDLVSRSIRMADMLPNISFVGGIERDSFNVSIENPQKIPVSWYVYQGSTLLETGFGTEFEYVAEVVSRGETYYVELLYALGGVDHIKTREFKFHTGALHISLDIPDRVYPGQKADVNIQVRDAFGNGVGDVDLTALATTAKLDYYPPDLPYYGTTSTARSKKATYSKSDVNKRVAILNLDYNKWAPRAHLDTMKHYQFTYPMNKMFRYATPIQDSTQFAAYVMQNGAAKQVYVVEVDRVPVYFSWADHPKSKSFYVEPDRPKQVTLRLFDRVVVLDSIFFERNAKTILSLDLDRLPKGVTVHKIAPQWIRQNFMRKYPKSVFTETEIKRYKPYLAAFTVSDEPSYLTTGRQFVPLSPRRRGTRTLIAGPVAEGMQTYTSHDRFVTRYRHSGGFRYEVAGNVVYKTDAPKLFPDRLFDRSFSPVTTLNDVAINKKLLLEMNSEVEEKWHPRVIDLMDYGCRVQLLLPFEEARSGVSTVLFQDCSTGVVVSPCRSYSTKPHYFTIPRGYHNVIVLYNNATYIRMDSIHLKSHTNMVADLRNSMINERDSNSSAWLADRYSNCFGSATAPSRTITFETRRNSIGNLHGSVMDDTNQPLPGATIVVKGTAIGTVTDIDGRFVLDIPADPSTIVVSFIGYIIKEFEVRSGSEVSIVMEPDIQQLQEIVVIGYGASRQSNLTSAVSSLQGRVAGVTISRPDIISREPNTGERSKEESDLAERQLYRDLLTIKNLRSNFSDVALWEPRLVSDRHGKCSFTVTFPDDLTRWDAVVYGMNRRLNTGTARKSIKSYKPLMAELDVPRFLVMGDSVNLTGKVLNYTAEKTIEGKTRWSGVAVEENMITFDSYHREVRPVIITATDTLSAGYSFIRNDGYLDGEERKIPIVEQGTLRANGTVSVLRNGDEVIVKPEKDEVIKLEFLASPLDLYAGDARNLIHYKYDCNEQLASKLIGLLSYKLVMQYEGKPFEYDNHVKRIIHRLLKNQNSEFLWSWWDVSPNTSYWMSAHILRALKAAKDAGYSVDLDIKNITRKATYKYDFAKDIALSDIEVLHALAMWNAQIDYERYAKTLESFLVKYDSAARTDKRRYRYSLLSEKFMLLEIRQLQRLSWVSDSLLRYKKENILNEAYFADDLRPRYWYSGALSANLIAYRMAIRDSALRDLRFPMQRYFLSLRRKGNWNTYESSNVLLSILPALLAEGSTKAAPALLSLSGKASATITTFPYKIEVDEGEELMIRKDAGEPVYYMQYTEEKVTTAKAGTDGFKIKTEFSSSVLKEGEPVILKTTIDIVRNTDLEHVMIEIPIPGGCSYADKRQHSNNIETHREYFKDRTVVFCQKMTPGTYVFQVHLIPRFTGRFHVNPAQISLMYFPVINANADMTKVNVAGRE